MEDLEDAMITEALAVRDGLRMAKDASARRIAVELDNISMVNLLKTPHGMWLVI